MSTCTLHTGHPPPTTPNEGEGQPCLHCLLAENHELTQQLKEKEHAIKVLEERKHETFFFLLLFFIKVYQSSHARMRKIQETIVKNNNYNIKVREERTGTPFLSPFSSPSTITTPFSSTDNPPISPPLPLPLSSTSTSTEAGASDDTNPTLPSPPPPLSPSPSPPFPAFNNNNSNSNNNNNVTFYDEPPIIQHTTSSNSSSSDSDTGGSSSDHDLSSTTPRGGPPSFPPPVLLPPPSIIANTHDSSESSLIKHFHHIIYENALDPVLVHDTEGWIVDANGAAVGLTGYSIEELRRKNIRELESRYVEPDPRIREQLLKGAAFRIYGEHISKQGRVFPVEVHISLATVEGKNYVVGLFRDVTEILRAKTLEKANEVAQATNRAKNIFLATMSHELTTPLYGVMASLEILKQSSPSLSDKQMDMLDCAMNSAVILKGIVNDILDLSVLELGMFRISKEPFSLTQRAATAFGVFIEAAKFQAISFKWLHDGNEVIHIPTPTTTTTTSTTSLRGSTTTSTSSTSNSTSASSTSSASTSARRVEYSNLPSLHVIGDPKRLQQVLMNLLSNAIKFTPRGGSVVLRTQIISEDERSYKFRIDVADTGIGLAPDQLQRVFEKFTQAQEGFTRKYSGTGLGLYISNKLVLLMGGKLAVKSEVQKGAVFTIDIRLMKHQGPLPMERISYEVETPPLVAAMAAYHRFGKKSSGSSSSSRHRRHSSSNNGNRALRRDDWREDVILKREKGKNISVFETRSRNDKFTWREVKLPKPKVGGGGGGVSRGAEEGAGADKEPPKIFATIISSRERQGAEESKGDESDLEVEVGGEGGGGGEGRGDGEGGGGEPSDDVTPSSSNDTSAEPSPRGSTPTSGGDDGKFGSALSVLLVEDNLVNQKVGKQLLRTLGVRDIDIANDGWHCLEMIKTRRLDKNKRMYNVILMDKQMPFLDGMEATRAIRQQEMDEGHLRIVIIALTADCRAGVDHEVLSAGMDDYLTKPVRANTLYNVFLKHGLMSPSSPQQPSPSSSSPPSS